MTKAAGPDYTVTGGFPLWAGAVWDAGPQREQRVAADAELAERIRVVHETDKAYGASRVTAELNDGAPPGKRVNHKRVARVMAERNIAGIRLRRRVRGPRSPSRRGEGP